MEGEDKINARRDKPTFLSARSSIELEMVTYSIRCHWCKRHVPVYECPSTEKIVCKRCLVNGDYEKAEGV